MNAIDASLVQLAGEVNEARQRLDIGQNEFARRCKVDPAVLSKLRRLKIKAGPTEKRIRDYLRRVADQHRADARARLRANGRSQIDRAIRLRARSADNIARAKAAIAEAKRHRRAV